MCAAVTRASSSCLLHQAQLYLHVVAAHLARLCEEHVAALDVTVHLHIQPQSVTASQDRGSKRCCTPEQLTLPMECR